MDFSFEDHAYNKALTKIGILGGGAKVQLSRVLIPFALCWLPLAVITLFQGTFWTGNMDTSFITSFDTQARFLITMPILILAEKLVSSKLDRILGQLKNSGIVNKEDHITFDEIIKRNVKFLKSHWTDIAVFVICYIHVFIVLFYKSENTSFLSWQIYYEDGEASLDFAGKWSTLISRPFILFLFYRWILRIVVWGNILRSVSNLKLNLFAIHPDLCGGLGFLGYSIRYFTPVAFAFSATIVGNMADFMLIEGSHLDDLKIPALAYLIFITILFTLPLIFFTGKLMDAREKSVFENYDFANGIYRELRLKFAKGYEKVNAEDLSSVDYSAAADLSAVVDNSLKMKFVPFTIKDLIPLWAMSTLPFLAVVLLEIPIKELFQTLISFLV